MFSRKWHGVCICRGAHGLIQQHSVNFPNLMIDFTPPINFSSLNSKTHNTAVRRVGGLVLFIGFVMFFSNCKSDTSASSAQITIEELDGKPLEEQAKAIEAKFGQMQKDLEDLPSSVKEKQEYKDITRFVSGAIARSEDFRARFDSITADIRSTQVEEPDSITRRASLIYSSGTSSRKSLLNDEQTVEMLKEAAKSAEKQVKSLQSASGS